MMLNSGKISANEFDKVKAKVNSQLQKHENNMIMKEIENTMLNKNLEITEDLSKFFSSDFNQGMENLKADKAKIYLKLENLLSSGNINAEEYKNLKEKVDGHAYKSQNELLVQQTKSKLSDETLGLIGAEFQNFMHTDMNVENLSTKSA